MLNKVARKYIAEGNYLRIDKAFVEKYPVLQHQVLYKKLAGIVTSLNICEVNEADAHTIMSLFPRIKNLFLHRIVILNGDISCFPKQITSLKIIDCRLFPLDFLYRWFDLIGQTVISFHVTRSYYQVPIADRHWIAQFVERLHKVEHVSFNDARFPLIIYLPPTIKQLVIVGDNCWTRMPRLPKLTHLCIDVRITWQTVKKFLSDLQCTKSLVTLVLRNFTDDPEILKSFTCLQYIRIKNHVKPEVKRALEAMPNLKRFDIKCYEHAKLDLPNQVLFNLPNECLLEILNHLDFADIISISKVDRRIKEVVFKYVFPRRNISFDDLLEKYPAYERLDLWLRLGNAAKSISFYKCSTFEHFLIPQYKHLSKLSLTVDDTTASYLRQLFKNLDPTLRSLRLRGQFDVNDLCELSNIRELDLSDLQFVNIDGFLRRNMDHLEKLWLAKPNSHNRNNAETVDDKLIPYILSKLRSIRLDYFENPIDINVANVPLLEELDISACNYSESQIPRMLDWISDCKKLKSLEFVSNFEIVGLEKLLSLQKLESLHMSVTEGNFLKIVKGMPNLKTFRVSRNKQFSLKFETELWEYLRTQNRTLAMHSSIHGLIITPDNRFFGMRDMS